MAELAKFGADTPFETNEVTNAEKVLIGFGLSGSQALERTKKSSTELRTIIGDTAAATGQNFGDMATYIGKFSAGATGEVLSRFAELGIATKDELKAMGVEFDKAGSMTTPVAEALPKLVELMQSKFGGGM